MLAIGYSALNLPDGTIFTTEPALDIINIDGVQCRITIQSLRDFFERISDYKLRLENTFLGIYSIYQNLEQKLVTEGFVFHNSGNTHPPQLYWSLKKSGRDFTCDIESKESWSSKKIYRGFECPTLAAQIYERYNRSIDVYTLTTQAPHVLKRKITIPFISKVLRLSNGDFILVSKKKYRHLLPHVNQHKPWTNLPFKNRQNLLIKLSATPDIISFACGNRIYSAPQLPQGLFNHLLRRQVTSKHESQLRIAQLQKLRPQKLPQAEDNVKLAKRDLNSLILDDDSRFYDIASEKKPDSEIILQSGEPDSACKRIRLSTPPQSYEWPSQSKF